MENRNEPIVAEETFNLSADKVWKAITELSQMKQWFFENIEDFKPEVGFETRFIVQSGEKIFTHLWRLTEVIPRKKIIYNWKYAEYPGEGFVTFELFEQDNQTRLKLTNTGLESFPKDIPEFSRESCIGGWNYFINQRLKIYLEKVK